MKKPSAQEIIEAFGLEPLPEEGGWFSQSYVSSEYLEKEKLSPRYGEGHPLYTVIYYLLTDDPDSFSALHRLPTDEVWHFYLGDPAELLLLRPDGSGDTLTLGQNILGGEHVQYAVPRDVWQGCRLKNGGTYALMGTTMAPGFIPGDFLLGKRRELLGSHPRYADQITSLTRQ